MKRRRDEVLVQRQEDEEYIIVCLKVRQGLVEDSWLAWRYRFGRKENDYGGGIDRGQKARRKRMKDHD